MLFLSLPPQQQQQQQQILPQMGSAQPWLPLPVAVGPLASRVLLFSSACAGSILPDLSQPLPPSEGQAGKGSQLTSSLQPPGMPGTAGRDHEELPHLPPRGV